MLVCMHNIHTYTRACAIGGSCEMPLLSPRQLNESHSRFASSCNKKSSCLHGRPCASSCYIHIQLEQRQLQKRSARDEPCLQARSHPGKAIAHTHTQITTEITNHCFFFFHVYNRTHSSTHRQVLLRHAESKMKVNPKP